MTNEELAVKAKGGNQDALLELWEQNSGLVYVMARRKFAQLEADGNTCGVELDDLKQAAFLALVSAVGYFETEKGIAFTTYWGNTVKTEFNALLGIRTSKRDPLNTALSLDAPLDDGPDNGTMGDTISDPKDAYSEAEERMWQELLHTVIDKALSSLPREEEKVLRLRYYDGLTFTEVSKALGLKNKFVARNLENAAFLKLHWMNRDVSLLSELEDLIDLHTNFYAVGSWERQESPVEFSVVRREEMRERYARRFAREPATIPAL